MLHSLALLELSDAKLGANTWVLLDIEPTSNH
jgi:hypothetical protein